MNDQRRRTATLHQFPIHLISSTCSRNILGLLFFCLGLLFLFLFLHLLFLFFLHLLFFFSGLVFFFLRVCLFLKDYGPQVFQVLL